MSTYPTAAEARAEAIAAVDHYVSNLYVQPEVHERLIERAQWAAVREALGALREALVAVHRERESRLPAQMWAEIDHAVEDAERHLGEEDA